VQAAFKRVDLVLIVAGTHKEVRAWELTDAESRALLEVNLHGPIGTVALAKSPILAIVHSHS
jgi:NADP-dependent 3-hydroxy acid dehydrogenase YdfG